MSNEIKKTEIERPDFFRRLIENDAAKRGFAAALAGLVVAAVSEAFWSRDE